MFGGIKKIILSYKNKKAIDRAYWDELLRLESITGDIAQAESIMWCRKHGWSDNGESYGRKPELHLIKGEAYKNHIVTNNRR